MKQKFIMKKIIFGVSFLIGCEMSSSAQKGSILLYGTLGVSTEKQPDDDKTTIYSIDPGIGYQFADKWTTGIMGGYGHQKYEPTIGKETESSSYKAGAFIRYTKTFNSIFSLFGQGDFYYHGNKIQEIKSNGFGVALTPTLGIAVSRGFALNISFGDIYFETIKIKDADDGTHNFDLNLGKQIGIGVSKNFGGRK